jgi:hypothetical protein
METTPSAQLEHMRAAGIGIIPSSAAAIAGITMQLIAISAARNRVTNFFSLRILVSSNNF